MKTWLTKFRISTALDSGKALPESLRRKIAADPALERFAYRAESLVRPLRNLPLADPSLHDGIMRAVRTSTQREEAQRAPMFMWLAGSASAAALALGYVWMVIPPSAQLDMPSPFGGLALLLRRAIEGAVLP